MQRFIHVNTDFSCEKCGKKLAQFATFNVKGSKPSDIDDFLQQAVAQQHCGCGDCDKVEFKR